MPSIRHAAVAGLFYPSDASKLQHDVDGLLRNADSSEQSDKSHSVVLPPGRPKAIIAPHAGYVYSGSTAARAYRLLRPYAEQTKRVVLLGPSHRVGFSGIAASSADFYETPLGPIPLDQAKIEKALDCPGVTYMDQAHLQEHSLEVHLPFLQTVLRDFTLTPLVVGDCSAAITGKVLDTLWGGDETLIVISSDLSHFLDYDTANALDHATCKAIESFNGDAINFEQACGRNPIKGLLYEANRHPLTIRTLGLCNSGDTAGDKSRVVGYGAWACWEDTHHA